MTMNIESPLLTVKEAAAFLRMSTSWLRKQCYAKQPGKLRPVRWGRSVRFRREDLERLVSELR
jgi:excisionase family DNA binding protein